MTETRIPSTELARHIGEILGRLRYGGETFIIERNGTPVAILAPYPPEPPAELADVLSGWLQISEGDTSLADDLETVGREDQPPDNPWA